MINPGPIAVFAVQIADRIKLLAPKLKRRWLQSVYRYPAIAVAAPDRLTRIGTFLREAATLLDQAVRGVGANHVDIQAWLLGFGGYLNALNTTVTAGEVLLDQAVGNSDVTVSRQMLDLVKYNFGKLPTLIRSAGGTPTTKPATDAHHVVPTGTPVPPPRSGLLTAAIVFGVIGVGYLFARGGRR